MSGLKRMNHMLRIRQSGLLRSALQYTRARMVDLETQPCKCVLPGRGVRVARHGV